MSNKNELGVTKEQLELIEYTYKKLQKAFETKQLVYITTRDIYIMEFLFKHIEEQIAMDNIYEVCGSKGFNGYSAVFVKAKDEKTAVINALSEFEKFHKGITNDFDNGSVNFTVIDIFAESDVFYNEA